ncbi:AfsR/SARP family transcriptional regulator [Actinoplanes sp. NPDC051343]|uniref:AfsR/SARP family transcriptional regulator n=1 Tax=Actinoplanes sp. NPDC051343 TaxID=3363906 RepID=UPI00378CB60A
MRFGILGPPEMWRDGRPISVGGPQQRALLAALLVNANRVVSADRLITYLWEDRPPVAARSLLQGCVAQLRRACRVADPDRQRLVTRTPGYVLEVAPGELDLDRFEAQVASAAVAPPARAAEILGAALALWRGPALDGVEVQAARTDAAHLEEQRLAVVEQRLEAGLRLGRYPTLITELDGYVRSHPLRERFWAMLMLAQYGADRQADALATFQRLRQTLIDQIGVPPSRSLRALQATILAGGDALAPYRSTPDAAPTPAQLPPAVSVFTGRDNHLSVLGKLLAGVDETTVVGLISGTAGVGKTALAVHWAHRVRDQFPDGQLFVNLQGRRPIDALAGFLQAFGTPTDQIPTEQEQATARHRSVVAGRRILVVLDNADSADQVRPLLPGGSGCLVLVTSRDRLGGLVARDGAWPITLDPLAEEDAVTLLERVLGPERVAAEPGQVAELARLCGRLPLALRIAAANLAGQPDRRITDEVIALSADDRLAALEVEGDRHNAVRAAFDRSYVALDPAERTLFRRLGLVPGPDVSAEAVATLGGEPPALDRLIRANLIQTTGSERHAMHDLLRLYAREQADGDDADAVARLFDWFVAGCDAAAQKLYPAKLRLPRPEPPAAFDDAAAAAAWLDAERANLVAATLHAAEKGPYEKAWALADGLRGFLWLRMHTVDWQTVASAGLAAATAAGDLAGQAACHLSMADLVRCQGRYPEAIGHYTQAAALAERAGWSIGHSAVLGNLGTAYFWLGELPAAAEQYHRALEIARSEGRLGAQAVRLGNLGLVSWLRGRFAEAADYQTQALALNRKLGERGNEGIDLANLGECEAALGNLDLARTHLRAALTIHEEVGDRGAEAESRAVLATVERDAGHLDEALRLARAAVDLTREAGENQIAANALNVLAGVHLRFGDIAKAAAGYEEALRSARATETRHAELGALLGLAAAGVAAGDAERARAYAKQALGPARAGGYRVFEAHAEAALAAAAMNAGDAETGARHARCALDIYQASGHRLGSEEMETMLGRRR